MCNYALEKNPRGLARHVFIITAILVSHLLPKFIPYQANAAFFTANSNNYPLTTRNHHYFYVPLRSKGANFFGRISDASETLAGLRLPNACHQRCRKPESIVVLSASKSRRNNIGNKKESNSKNRRKETKIERSNRLSREKRINDRVQMRVERLLERHNRGDTITQYDCDRTIGLCYAANAWYYVKTVVDLMNKNGIEEERSTFGACLSECFNAGNGHSALKVVSRMEDSKLKLDAEDVRLTVLALCRNNKEEPGLWENAFELLLRYANEGEGQSHTVVDVVAYNAVMNCLGEEQRWDDSITLLKLMEQGYNTTDDATTFYHPIPNTATYHAVLNSLTSSNSDQGIEIIKSLVKRGTIPTVYTFELVLLTLLKDHKRLERAVDLLDMMYDLKIISPTLFYNKAISALARVGQLESAANLLSKMKERKIERDIVTFNALIAAFANKGRVTDALELLNECKEEKNVELDVITYTNAIRACARGRMSVKALELLDEVKEIGLPLDAYLYTAAIDACAKGRLWKQAIYLFEDMKENGVIPNDFTYSALINACGNGGQWERSLELIDQMRQEKVKISTVTYNAAIAAVAKTARSNARQSTRGSNIKYRGTGTDKVRTRYIEGGIDEAQLWRKTLELIGQMKEDRVWPDAYSYSTAISACGSGGQWEEALRLIKIMQKGPPKARPNKISYTGAISACGRCGEWAPALQLFVNMKADRIKCDTVSYNALLSALVNGDQADMAYDIWNEMCDEAKKVRPDIISLTSVIASLERAKGKDKEEKMNEVFASAVDRQIILPEDSMDTKWEIDLSGMSLPVARAACRFIIKRLQQEVKEGEDCEDLMLITGVGRHHYEAGYFKKESNDDFLENDIEGGQVGNSNEEKAVSFSERTPGTTALREYVRQVLREDFEVPIYSVIPNNADGVVQVPKETFQKCILKQEQRN